MNEQLWYRDRQALSFVELRYLPRLAVYENGKWSKAPGSQYDYMGFSATAKHLYSSGHSVPRSGLVNPFGRIG